jgi:hypothetical protein
VNARRWVSVAILLGAAIFAYFGGQFGTPDYLEMRHTEDATRDSLVALRKEVDSLTLFRDSLANNVGVQERYAREQWGWLRPGELSFKILADTVKE